MVLGSVRIELFKINDSCVGKTFSSQSSVTNSQIPVPVGLDHTLRTI